jgi:hypothetical protein
MEVQIELRWRIDTGHEGKVESDLSYKYCAILAFVCELTSNEIGWTGAV